MEAGSEQARVSAIKEMFDRGWGKASQAIEHSGAIGSYDLTKVSDEDLARLEAILGSIADDGSDPEGEGEA